MNSSSSFKHFGMFLRIGSSNQRTQSCSYISCSGLVKRQLSINVGYIATYSPRYKSSTMRPQSPFAHRRVSKNKRNRLHHENSNTHHRVPLRHRNIRLHQDKKPPHCAKKQESKTSSSAPAPSTHTISTTPASRMSSPTNSPASPRRTS